MSPPIDSSAAVHRAPPPGDAAAGAMRRAPALKSPRRAAEKAATCYGGDVSLLLDVCRERIWFGSLGGLARCLECLAADPSACVVRVKDLLTPQSGGDSGRLWGFRAVIANVAVTTILAGDLGVENHICEVQLVLDVWPFMRDADIWSLMHARYLALRRAYAESWENQRGTLITTPAARSEIEKWHAMQYQGKDVVEMIEGGMLTQSGDVNVQTREAPGKCSEWEQEITLVVDGDAIQSEITCWEGNTGKDEEAIFSVVSSVDTEDTMYSIPATPSLRNLDLYLRLTLLPGNAIDSQLEFVARAFRHSNSGSALFTRLKNLEL